MSQLLSEILSSELTMPRQRRGRWACANPANAVAPAAAPAQHDRGQITPEQHKFVIDVAIQFKGPTELYEDCESKIASNWGHLEFILTIYFVFKILILQVQNEFPQKFPGVKIPYATTNHILLIKQNEFFMVHNLNPKTSPGDSHIALAGRDLSVSKPALT